MEVLAPFFADIGMIERNKVHNVGEVTLVELAAIVRQQAASRSGKPDFRGIAYRAPLGYMHVNGLVVFRCPEENGVAEKELQFRHRSSMPLPRIGE